MKPAAPINQPSSIYYRHKLFRVIEAASSGSTSVPSIASNQINPIFGKSYAMDGLEALENLELLSLVSKITTELSNHLGMYVSVQPPFAVHLAFQ